MNTKSTALEQMAAFAVALRTEQLPRSVVAKVKDCVVDALSACLTIGSRDEGNAALTLVRARPGDGSATVFGTADRAGASDAGFVNAVAAFGTARSDTHKPTASHPGSVVIPAVLALAEARTLSGDAAVAAIVAGYETMLRIGEALITPAFARTFRPTAMIAAPGTALACGRLLKLDQTQLCAAGSLGTQTAFGLNEWANAKTSELAYHSGFATRNGIDCALLAEAGARAAPSVLEGPMGLLAGFGALPRSSRLTEELGSEYRLLDVVHKPAPACIYVQSPSQVAYIIVRDHKISATQIKEIEIEVSEAASLYPGCNDSGPISTAQAARLSIQFAVGAVIAHSSLQDKCWREFDHPVANELAGRSRLSVPESPHWTGEGCRINVTLQDGRVISAQQDDVAAMSSSDLVERFLVAAEPRLGKTTAMRVLDLINDLERLNDITPLNRLLAAAEN